MLENGVEVPDEDEKLPELEQMPARKRPRLHQEYIPVKRSWQVCLHEPDTLMERLRLECRKLTRLQAVCSKPQ
eukprot:993663-Amphidinium_carterae.1